jgi:hypothetical protein
MEPACDQSIVVAVDAPAPQPATGIQCSRIFRGSPGVRDNDSPGLRRNESAAAQLQGLHRRTPSAELAAKRNKSHSALSELASAESSERPSDEVRAAVIDAVVMQLIHHKGDVAMDDSASAAIIRKYIDTIVRQLALPNSCIVAALVYVERAIARGRFILSDANWQPALLAAFVVAAKLSFDEPVWNEDFATALQIKNVPVTQISRWEASFLQLLDFDTNVQLQEYAACCNSLQQRYHAERGQVLQFFSFLVLQVRSLATRPRLASCRHHAPSRTGPKARIRRRGRGAATRSCRGTAGAAASARAAIVTTGRSDAW